MINNRVISTPPLQAQASRIYWVDAAKALGLFLVFWGHILYGGSPIASVINRAIYSFHMPMYFILSGYVLKKDTTPFADYVNNKFYRIFLPAALLYLLTLPIYFLSLDYSETSLKHILADVFYIIGDCAYNLPIWFFFCMFQVLIVSKLLRLSEANLIKVIIVVLISLLLSFVFYVTGWKFFKIFGFDKCVLGLFFLSVGVLMRKLDYERMMKMVGVVGLLIWIVSGVILNTKVSMYGMDLGNFWLFLLSGICGSWFFFSFCKLFEKCERVRAYSEWTIFIVCTHYVLVGVFSKMASVFSIRGTYLFDISSAVFVLLALLAYKPICVFIKKLFPILMGQKRYAKNC